uniref:Repressor of yield of DENV protein homolog n=1 Tax=Crassostrea virginica TaxID=6565 RepID=A0A8B8E480_CRAVI|nr:repressor of yield of DENV protein homolog [Crassostrea virginica]
MADVLEEVQRQKQIGKFQELFRGRFSEAQAYRLLNHHHWNLGTAVDFVFEEEANRVKEVAGTEDDRWLEVLSKQAWKELARQKHLSDVSIRQFACGPCDKMWWRRVPSRKAVSKCFRCRKRFDAVPRDNEWGVAEFTCECENVFRGYGQMNNTYCPCYVCHRMVQPSKILPKTRGHGYRRNTRAHSCYAGNCYNRADGQIIPDTICVHPKSLGHRVVTPSDPHTSTGSTVNTFLTQDDLASISSGSYHPNLSDVDEND